MQIIKLASELQAAQSQFEQSLRSIPHESVDTTIGYQVGTFAAQVIWVPSFDIWGCFGLPPDEKPFGNRFWNPFGIGQPQSQVLIVCEINPPRNGINPVTGGIFLQDNYGKITVAHRCRFTVTGGIPSDYFLKHFTGNTLPPSATQLGSPLAKVAELGSPSFGDDISKFVREVHRIKEARRAENAARQGSSQSRPTTH